ncbi:MAG: 4-hydroxythreonine-4-phosphate dehydrogenase PdxA [Bacteroidia bacterium]|nr:4-hydroxythreonine-4-phosphate dehydrogenase PdxA [Bacteroidia bacterium]MBT8275534.1 4-hydroxythreonine-4-phosphate dehydrogenase PdxA [Bacteroidia bacterium]NNF31459.1 4-hydroxythreonine-4-phosphate dehydrogenase PdxA [Flavobacteriaceae bacterium]NNK54038.1 4-hydroxythreonine-4-phosphate dehydrogenase PdxA [Flavobacteriaceae bacterium]
MSKKEKIIVGISIGDLNGIGSEIVLKTFQDNRMLEFCTPVVFASVKLMSYIKKVLELDVNLYGIDSLDKIVHKKINVLNVWKEQLDIKFGEEDKAIGSYAIKSLEAAVAALKDSKIDVLVTAPINKSNVQSESFNFPGHTDYLAKELGGESLMLMISDGLRVGLLTDHVAVKDVSTTITRELIEKKIKTIYKTLIQDFGISKPKIAVLGINPHVGDQGVIGTEDDEILIPTLNNLRNNGKLVFGPYAADSFFGSGNYKNFDAVIASYHDQGLVPFKTLTFGNGVNYTAGLSKIRTSPDHGTAYDMAGKNKANYESFKQAVFSAIEIHRKREEYRLLSKDPLKVNPKKTFAKKK